MNKEEYSRYCSQFQARVRKNLKFAAPPDVLKNILKSKDHRILIKPDRLQIGGAYSPKLNVVVICMNDAMTDEMIQVTLRNEYFHAMTCTPMGEIHTKPQDKCLDSSQITLLHKAVLKGHNRIHRLEFDFKYHLANPQVKLESASKLSKFLNVINFYQDFRTIEYQTKEQYQQFIRYLPHTRLPDGRLHVPKGAITLSGKKSLADSYLTVTPIHNQIRITISFLKDNSVNSKASAFFADFQLLQDRYANVNFYGGESLSKKVQNWGSDAAQLPAQLKGLLYPEFCEIADSISGFKDYCGIQETTLVCESDECRISPR